MEGREFSELFGERISHSEREEQYAQLTGRAPARLFLSARSGRVCPNPQSKLRNHRSLLGGRRWLVSVPLGRGREGWCAGILDWGGRRDSVWPYDISSGISRRTTLPDA